MLDVSIDLLYGGFHVLDALGQGFGFSSQDDAAHCRLVGPQHLSRCKRCDGSKGAVESAG